MNAVIDEVSEVSEVNEVEVDGEVAVEEVVEEVAMPTTLELLDECLSLDADGFDHLYAADLIVQASNDILFLTHSVFGSPGAYGTKAAFRREFSDLRELPLMLRRLLNRFRNDGLLEQRDNMLDAIEPGNKPSVEKMQADMQMLMKKIAMRKQAEGIELSEAEEAALNS